MQGASILKRLKFNRRMLLPGSTFFLLVIALVYQLHRQGRIWWCACGRPFLWAGDIWSSHNSQHLLDPYSLTHILHGVVFFGLLYWVLPQVQLIWRLWIATFIEALWEIIENTQFVIQRYRETTISLGYEGDSIINSLGDLGGCVLGFFLAWRLGLRRSLIFFGLMELILLLWIRDNLTLNIIMLIYPIEAIKSWQMIP